MSSNPMHRSITILAAALLFFTLFQFTQVLTDRAALDTAKKQINERLVEADKVVAQNQKMLDQLNAIAIGTQRLSEAGNANAKEIVAQLTKLGIKINPNFKAEQAGAEGAAPPAPGPGPGAAPPPGPAPGAPPAPPAP